MWPRGEASQTRRSAKPLFAGANPAVAFSLPGWRNGIRATLKMLCP